VKPILKRTRLAKKEASAFDIAAKFKFVSDKEVSKRHYEEENINAKVKGVCHSLDCSLQCVSIAEEWCWFHLMYPKERKLIKMKVKKK
jgi:hypothetical protein